MPWEHDVARSKKEALPLAEWLDHREPYTDEPRKFQYQGHRDLDPECRPLCAAINHIKGLRTAGSCCGHGKKSFSISFRVESPKYLPLLLYYINKCHSGFAGWQCRVCTDCAMGLSVFSVRSSATGRRAYKEAAQIAKNIMAYFGRKGRYRRSDLALRARLGIGSAPPSPSPSPSPSLSKHCAEKLDARSARVALKLDARAVLSGYANNERLRRAVKSSSLDDLEAWLPEIPEAARNKAKIIPKHFAAFFKDICDRDIFLGAQFTKAMSYLPSNVLRTLSQAVVKYPDYRESIRRLFAAIESGEIIREEGPAEDNRYTFRRGGR